ncbi:MraZ protein [Candidatus Kryptobacter tengchongensis]|uniref:division/cell wall cluster transcriptional repressor MraZ n=1 Tax=Kryptobacter tengchongensis TaxID=1643429 RepID=UPI0007083120|nr:division/cell wall cluster transcriptional repressor MraZ [Candidatus Kryptobacter tengchongensis]CUS87618.1 MraZ protein [Candidatus Kryptobacter tengchongensis]CUU09510.1 MraZ protein [Candidatus Kryptobacter tengchongensis]CUU10393.1 MraZ protein [Candidatus Kryptobacter tengchongensis]
MSSFKGSYIYAVDEKGRVSIPARMRKYLSPEANETFVITRGTETCLFLFPLDEWEKLEKRLKELNTFNPQHRLLVRILLMWAVEVTLDNQSRIMIPKNLLEFAKIDKEALIIGALDRIEIWNPEVFNEYVNTQPESYESIAEKVLGMK